MKICSKCNNSKELIDFYKGKSKCGLRGVCKICDNENRREYHNKNKDISNYKAALRYEHNKEEKRKYSQKNKEKIKEYLKHYYSKNKDILNEKAKVRRKEFPEITQHYSENYYKKNKIKCIDRSVRYTKKKLENDIEFRLLSNLRSRLRSAIKNNSKKGSAVRDLGCSIFEFRKYIETKFTDGMSWDNYGFYGWHIDHIIPLSRVDLNDREQLLSVCHYRNLQPLWAKDNLKKSSRIE